MLKPEGLDFADAGWSIFSPLFSADLLSFLLSWNEQVVCKFFTRKSLKDSFFGCEANKEQDDLDEKAAGTRSNTQLWMPVNKK